jgi:phospholipid transport system transporter-binding protein
MDPQLVRVEPGRYKVSGSLAFETARQLLGASEPLFAADPPHEIDLANVTTSDSAGLALLIEWARATGTKGQELRFINTPAQMLALAKMSDLDKVLSL